ncbi:hypothetical protein ACTD5D_39935 [Nocardia takedensis]|uniref:hypothetical protein n=1 Tax=Nocardia takedensis TaxID=259390 RepID=UPI003F76C90A
MGERDEDEVTVRATFDQLDRWRAATAPFEPGSGSQLRGDDDDWPPCALSQVAHQGLAVAVEHLQAVRAHVDLGWSRVVNLYPLAHATLCRTALVGAAQTVWLLAPDDRDERLRRHRVIVAEMQKRHLQYLTELQALTTDAPHEGTDRVADHVALRIREMSDKRAARGEKGGLDTTTMIREAALAAFAAHPDPEDLARQAVLVWRSGSGAAHGFYWQVFGRPGTEQVTAADSRGLATFSVGGSFQAIAQSYMAAYHLCAFGWTLLRRRGQ